MSIIKEYEVYACRETKMNDGTGIEVTRCEDSEADYFTVYRRLDDGRTLALCDCTTRHEAECVQLELTALLEGCQIGEKFIAAEVKSRDAISGQGDSTILNRVREAMMTGA